MIDDKSDMAVLGRDEVKGRSHLSHCILIFYKTINAVCVGDISGIGNR